MTRRETSTGRVRGTAERLDLAARQLRQRLTPAERALWAALRGRQLDGLKFRRQYPVGPYVLDFYCPEGRLVVELDGEIHNQQADYDADRDAHLRAYGYRVLRFRNEQVFHDLPAVLDQIRHAARSQPE